MIAPRVMRSIPTTTIVIDVNLTTLNLKRDISACNMDVNPSITGKVPTPKTSMNGTIAGARREILRRRPTRTTGGGGDASLWQAADAAASSAMMTIDFRFNCRRKGGNFVANIHRLRQRLNLYWLSGHKIDVLCTLFFDLCSLG